MALLNEVHYAGARCCSSWLYVLITRAMPARDNIPINFDEEKHTVVGLSLYLAYKVSVLQNTSILTLMNKSW
jgi:hypothetical protein